jgi:hypothetical protein
VFKFLINTLKHIYTNGIYCNSSPVQYGETCIELLIKIGHAFPLSKHQVREVYWGNEGEGTRIPNVTITAGQSSTLLFTGCQQRWNV